MRVDETRGLEVTITPDTPKRLQRGYIAAVTHGVEIVDEPSDDAAKGAASGAGQVSLATASGDGTVWLRPSGMSMRVFAVEHPMTLLDTGVLVALDASVTTTLGDTLDRTLGVARTARRAWEIGGTGAWAIGASGLPGVLTVGPDEPLLVESGALVAYSSSLTISEPDDYKKRVGSRGLKKLLSAGFDKLGLPIDLAGRRERLWIVLEGDGRAILQDVID